MQLVSALLLAPRLLRGCHCISEADCLKFTTAFLPCTCMGLSAVRRLQGLDLN